MTILWVLILLWFIRTAKAILFWLYLWQLKEYHIGRFIDHFRTAKGKELLFSPLLLGKILLFFGLLWYPALIWAFFLLYGAESANAARGFFRKKLLRPVFTLKTIVLTAAGLFVQVLFLIFTFVFFQKTFFQFLLAGDIFIPFFVSLFVLAFQPFAVLGKRRIIQKAIEKRVKLPNLKVVGITGSYGKTSTKEFLAHILSQKFKVLKTKEHQNSEVGIAQCILNELQPEHEVFVCEMGAYNKGGIRLLASIAKPQIGILTGINEQHMATFGSQENIIKAKYELIESLPPNGVAFFNSKNTYCVDLYNKTTVKKVLYGQGARFRGEENILGAMAVAKELGMSDEEIASAVKELENTFPGVQIRKGAGGFTVIDATYSANPDGVIANLEYLKTFPSKKVIVMPCLIELGKASKEVHKRIGEKIAEVCDLAIITTKDRFEDIIEGAKGSQKVLFLENPEEIVEKIKSTTTAGDVVLLEGRVPKELCKLLYVQS